MLRHRLTDQQWELVQDLFPPPARTGRPRRDRREILDGILGILRTGAPWRDLPGELGPWATAWDLFDTWNDDGRSSPVCGPPASTWDWSIASCGASMAP